MAADERDVAAETAEEATVKGDAALSVGSMDRFAPKAREALAVAADQVRQLGRREVRPEHVLLALLTVEGSGVLRFLRAIYPRGVAERAWMDDLRARLLARLEKMDGAGLPGLTGPAGLSDGCKQVLQEALTEAKRLNAPQVNPAHLFVGIVAEGSALAGTQLLSNLALRGLRVSLSTRVWRSTPPDAVLGGPKLEAATGPFDPTSATRAPTPAPAPAPRDNVITFRVTNADLKSIDALVDAGAMRTRSEASAWLVESGIATNRDFFDQIGRIVDEIARLRADVQQLIEARLGPSVADIPTT